MGKPLTVHVNLHVLVHVNENEHYQKTVNLTSARRKHANEKTQMNYLAASHEVSGLCEQHKLCLMEPIVIINALFFNIFLDDCFITFFTNCADIVSGCPELTTP